MCGLSEFVIVWVFLCLLTKKVTVNPTLCKYDGSMSGRDVWGENMSSVLGCPPRGGMCLWN